VSPAEEDYVENRVAVVAKRKAKRPRKRRGGLRGPDRIKKAQEGGEDCSREAGEAGTRTQGALGEKAHWKPGKRKRLACYLKKKGGEAGGKQVRNGFGQRGIRRSDLLKKDLRKKDTQEMQAAWGTHEKVPQGEELEICVFNRGKRTPVRSEEERSSLSCGHRR